VGRARPRYGGWLWLIFLALLAGTAASKIVDTPGLLSMSLAEWAPVLPLLIYVPLFFYGGRLREWLALRKWASDPANSEPQILAISEEALTAGGTSASLTIHWHLLPQIGADEGHAFFYLNDTEGFILPRRAFATDREFEDFVAAARRYHQEARRFLRPENPG
jgi:hypothetical protein